MSRKKVILKKKKSILNIFTTIFIVFSVIGLICWTGLFLFNRYIDKHSKSDDNKVQEDTNISKKEILNVLFCGENQNLTDTMMYIKYNSTNGKISIMSIPRDTYVNSQYSSNALGGHKLNAIYTGKKNIDELLRLVNDITGVTMDYYVIISNDIVKELVNEIGGVEIDVPINMKYDDESQDLHINLKKGVQVLDGAKAEQFVRFRHNNNGTGYANGDIERIQAQQKFMKAFISQFLSAKNITKIGDIIGIVTKNTDTNMTAREALKYATDVTKIQTDNITTVTAPGASKYITETSGRQTQQISYYVVDKVATQKIINSDFTTENNTTNNNIVNSNSIDNTLE